jgi:hypothetical protein
MERSEILTEDWLLRCWHERDNRQFNPFDSETIRIHRAKPLHNLNLFFFGVNNESEIEHLNTLTNENGKFKKFDYICRQKFYWFRWIYNKGNE